MTAFQDAGTGHPVAHQMLWQASSRNLLGGSGFGPVASSLPAEQLGIWTEKLRGMLNAVQRDMPEDEGQVLPEEFLHRRIVVSDLPFAVVARKRSTVDDLGRPGSSRTHVLITAMPMPALGDTMGGSSAPRLSARAAIGLTSPSWDRYLTGPDGVIRPDLHPINLGVLEEAGDVGFENLHNRLRRLGPEEFSSLSDIAARVLAAPETRSHLIPAPATMPGELLLCGLYQLLHGVVRVAWTFSTCETMASARSAGDQFVCVDGYSYQDPATSPAVDRWIGGAAREMTRVLVQEGPEQLVQYRPARRLADLAAAQAWAEQIQSTPGSLRDSGGIFNRAVRGDLNQTDLIRLKQGDEFARLRETVKQQNPAEMLRLINTWQATAEHGAITYRPEEHTILAAVLDEAVERLDLLPFSPASSRLSHRDDSNLRSALMSLGRAEPEQLRAGFSRLGRAQAKRIMDGGLAGKGDSDDPLRPWRSLYVNMLRLDAYVDGGMAAAVGALPLHALVDAAAEGARQRNDERWARLSAQAWQSATSRPGAQVERPDLMALVVQRTDFVTHCAIAHDLSVHGVHPGTMAAAGREAEVFSARRYGFYRLLLVERRLAGLFGELLDQTGKRMPASIKAAIEQGQEPELLLALAQAKRLGRRDLRRVQERMVDALARRAGGPRDRLDLRR